ncbi:MAG TPA: type VI secretion system tip protein TssI/VgrG [Burkholderiales bacterium]|nr:type VI secretion system tip protein TssI/VgrG [Burkholderiales bacterium]
MDTATGKHRFAQINTQLGADVLLLARVSGKEELGRLFEYDLELLSERATIKPEDLLGTNVTLMFETEDHSAPRYLNAYVTRFCEAGEKQSAAFSSGHAYAYRATLRPWLWFATRRSDCRIFNDKSVPDIVKEVLGIYGGQISDKLSGTHHPWKYCVQYRETDFNFVSRLMEHEGIYYYFDHQNGKHLLVLADSSSAHAPHPKFRTFAFHQPGREDVFDRDYISEWMATTGVQAGRYLLKDYDFYRARAVEGVAAQPRSHTFGDLEMYDYPAAALDVAGAESGSDRSSGYASARMEELQSQYRVFEGTGNARGLEVARRFTLTDHPQRAYNADYVVTSASLEAKVNEFRSGGGDAEFKVTFTSIAASQAFRPQRLTPKSVIQGTQTALVVGNGEIDPDKHGRVKVQFHWDRKGATCWVRVAQLMAGKSWGAMFLPRVGQEVIVDFLEGDPDRPIVTGVIYNGVAKPPYELPGEKTKWTIKTNSSEGGGGFNELRFEDKKGSEQIFMHGEKQLDLRIKKDRLEFIGENSHHIVKKDRYEKVEKDQHLAVKGDQNEKVTGTASLKIDQNLQYKVGMKSALDSGQEIHLKAGMNIILEAGVQISLKVGGNFINITPAGVDIQGILTKINCGGSAGSGSGSSPAAPTDPKEADDAKAGSKDDVPPKPKPPQAKTYSPKAVSLKLAAQSGAPFVDV